jgi:hypothetical protein
MKVKDYKEQIDSYLDYGNTIWFINDETKEIIASLSKEIIASLWNKKTWYKEVFNKLGDCEVKHQTSRPLINEINLYIETDVAPIME